MAATADQAHRALQQILAGPAYQPQPLRRPWWVQGLQWLFRHLHLSLTRSSATTLAWLMIAVVGVGLLLLLIFALRSFRHRAQAVWLPSRAGTAVPPLQRADQAFAQGVYDDMLRDLLDACLEMAEASGWIRRAPWKTLRMYQRDLAPAAPPAFVELFHDLALALERVRFAGQPLARDVAQAWLMRVQGSLRAQPA